MAAIRDLILNIIEKKEGNALTAAANDIEKLGRGVDVTGKAMKDFENDTKRVNAEIEKSTARIKELHKQVAATGDTSLFGDIRKEEARIKGFRATLQNLANDANRLGAEAGTGFLGGISSAFKGFAGTPVLGPIIVGAVIGAIGSLGPILFSELGGLVAGAVGTVGVVGGVLTAIKDPRVKSAFATFADDIQNAFFGDHEAFVEPIRQSLAGLSKDFADLHLSDAFAKAAPFVQTIAEGIGNLAKNIMPGFNNALDRIGPFARAAADGFADIGKAIGYFLDRVTQSKGTLEGLKTLFAFISGTIVGIADLIYHAGQAYDWFIRQNEKLFRVLGAIADATGQDEQAAKFRKVADVLHQLQQETPATSHAIDGLGGSFDKTATATERFNAQAAEALPLEEDLINKSLTLDNAVLAVAQGWLDLNDQLVKGKGNWSDNTEAGIHNQQMLNDQIAKIDAVRKAEIAKSDGSVAAINAINAEYDKQLAKLLKVAAAAGDSQAAIEALAKKYYIDIIVTREERNQITKANAIDQALGKLLGFAEGGLVPGPSGAPQLAVVHGGERVLTPSQQAAIAGSSGGGTLQIQVGGSPNGPLEALFTQWLLKVLRDHVRFNGGSADIAFS